jgi:DNA-binding SARP family transcriptional activator/Tfp pilus assembly protein PilF
MPVASTRLAAQNAVMNPLDRPEFGLLGPLVVRTGTADVALPPGKQRVVLAALLLSRNRVVPIESLAVALWGSAAPPSAGATIRNYVRRLRAALGPADRTRIKTVPGGYLIHVTPEELDVARFEAFISRARVAARTGAWEEAAGSAEAALRLWRGEPLADVDSPALMLREAPRLTELRLQAVEMRVDAALQLGLHADVIGELRQLAAENPLRERVYALLMLALYRDGRQAEALAVYRQARTVLAEELGTEPGEELRKLHQRILVADAVLASPAHPAATAGRPTVAEGAGPAAEGADTAAEGADTPADGADAAEGADAAAEGAGPAAERANAGADTPADDSKTGAKTPADGPRTPAASTKTALTPGPRRGPRQLPARVRHFTGRQQELATLSALLDQAADHQPQAILISAIGGTAGVGKTALALHWAHEVSDRFPDGQLYVNLQGYDPAPPVPAADALAGFLRALGIPGEAIAAETDERAAQYRSMLADKRMLLFLDNAYSAEQVRPLLPGSRSCAVVVTSRDSLTGLAARDGARRLELDLLPLPEAVGLLSVLIGTRVDADPAAAAALAERCSRLPLALRVAAEHAAAHPALRLADLAEELADQQRKLELLDAGGDPRADVGAVFSWSLRHLESGTARAFRLLGLHPGPDFDAYAVAALMSGPLEAAEQGLSELARAHLVQRTGPDRYSMHDLLRSYAGQLAAEDDEHEQRTAVTRLLDYYLGTASAAMDTLIPAEQDRRPRVTPARAPVPSTGGTADARAWLDRERAVLVGVAACAAARGFPGHAVLLAATLFRYLDTGGHYPEAVAIHGHAQAAAAQMGDRAAEARALSNLTAVDLRQGRYDVAVGHFEQILALFRAIGDRPAEARVLGNLGGTCFQLGRYESAAGHLQQALTLFRQTGERSGEAHALSDLGLLDLRQGRYGQADDRLRLSLELYRQTGEPTGAAHALATIAMVDLRQSRHREADEHLRQALALCRSAGDRSGEARVLSELGLVDLGQDRYEQADAHLREALELCRGIGDRDGEAEAQNGLGDCCLARGAADRARAHYASGLELAVQVGDVYEQARAHDGLARALRQAGDAETERADEHARRARDLYAQLGTPEANQVRS